MKKRLKTMLVSVAAIALLSLAVIVTADSYITSSTKEFIYEDISAIPANRVGVLLGTTAKLRSGRDNVYFTKRIAATAALYKAGKIQYIIVSGDNRKESYNEPEDMRRALMAAGVDSARIYLDFAGFRTFDSMVRAREIFGQDSFTVISQRFHNQRAVFLARRYGIGAIAYNAGDVNAYYGFKTMIREKFARVKVFADMAMGTKPHFLGEKIEVQ
jgi:SanA protein